MATLDSIRKGEDITRRNYQTVIVLLQEQENSSNGILKMEVVKSFLKEWFK